MYFALMGKLSARRQNLTTDKDKGFTLIELLVVVIIIGILAAIAIPVYLGVQNNAKDSAVRSDVSNMKTAVVSIMTNAGSLPATTTFSSTNAPADPWPAAGTTLSENTASLVYTPNAGKTDFCIVGTSVTSATKKFYATQSTGVSDTKPAACP